MSSILINQWKLSPQEYRIYRGKQKIELQPKCAELLKYLAERPGQVVSKETLLSVVWNGRVVGEDVLTSCIRKLRRVFDDDAKSPHVIETINKKGYRMIAKVRQPRTRSWWIRTIGLSIVSLIYVAYLSFLMTHSNISVYRFSTTDTAEQRQQKLQEMAGIIDINPDGTYSLSISHVDD